MTKRRSFSGKFKVTAPLARSWRDGASLPGWRYLDVRVAKSHLPIWEVTNGQVREVRRRFIH